MTAVLNGVQSLHVAGDITADGYISSKKSGVFAFLTAQTNTTCTLADTWYSIAGSFTNLPIEDFVFDTDHIKYIGKKTQFFEIDWQTSMSGDANGITPHVAISINGTPITGSIMGQFLKTSGEAYAMAGTCIVELSTDDEVQIVVKADGVGDVISFYHFTTSISEFFD